MIWGEHHVAAMFEHLEHLEHLERKVAEPPPHQRGSRPAKNTARPYWGLARFLTVRYNVPDNRELRRVSPPPFSP